MFDLILVMLEYSIEFRVLLILLAAWLMALVVATTLSVGLWLTLEVQAMSGHSRRAGRR